MAYDPDREYDYSVEMRKRTNQWAKLIEKQDEYTEL
jgi:hypothetical protein